jgi:hypothetical protein
MNSIRLAVAGLALCVLAACGGGGGTPVVVTPPVVVPPAAVSWALKTANHGLLPTFRTGAAAIGNTLYAAGSTLATPNFLPQLYQSVDGGVSWTNTNLPPPGFTSLIGFRIVSDGAFLYLIGGRTSDNSVTTVTSYTYNNNVLKFTPGSPGIWTTVAVNAFSASVIPGGRENLAVAWDGAYLYAYGGIRLNTSTASLTSSNAVFRSSNGGVTWTIVNDASSYSNSRHCLMSSAVGVLYSVGGFGFAPNATTGADVTQILKSTNAGVSWTPMTSPLPIPTLAQYASCAALNGRLYVLGGATVTSANLVLYTSDIWQSADNGFTWSKDAPSVVFGERAIHGTTAFNGKLVVFGGQNTAGLLADVIEGTP